MFTLPSDSRPWLRYVIFTLSVCRCTMATNGKVEVSPNASKEIKDIAESLELAHNEIAKMKKYLDQKFEYESSLEKRIEMLEKENREIRDYASDIEEYVL